MKPAPGRQRLSGLPVVLLLLLFLSFLLLEAAGPKDAIVALQEGHASQHGESRRFCYTNTRVPRWNDVDSEEELEKFSLWNVLFSFLRGKLNDTSIDVDLYSNKTCLKVELLEPGTTYSVVLFRRFDPKLFLVFFLGLLLFFCGDTMSRSQIFYYSAGISVGLLASLLVLVYMMYKVMPKLIFKNLREICKSYWQYLLGYLLLVGLLSFAVCYRYGPLENERSINLLSWALQLLGLLLIYSGIQIHPIALGLVLIAVCTKNLDYPLQWAFAVYRRVQSSKLGPTPPRLLTEEEFQLQGEVETRKALAELRSFCQSPEFSAWTTVSRIQSPKRFADFVGGASHVTPSEVSAHEREFGLESLSIDEELFEEDDDDDDDDDEEEENIHDSSGGNHRSDFLPHNHVEVQ
ncbi:Transmembrane protein 194A [Lonchura striata]|uniref:Transmembrane protein 194A n=1 Tax=Lonchura striata TaxID=40157 RepID=A0A218UDV1_9PASE|nr:Transmembrane protein 194A [Lonchura striata domestica]